MKYLHQLFLIEEDETGSVLYFLAFLVFVGFGMALGNATANSLFLKRFGIDYLPLMYLLQGAACFITSLFYASVADLIPAERFFKILFALLATVVLTFWILISSDVNPLVFPAYFLFYEVIADLLLIHSALYINQNLNTLQAKRLSPIIFSGQQIGMIIGGLFLTFAAPVIGTENILVVWLVFLLMSLSLIATRHKLKGLSPYFRPTRKSANKLQHMTSQITQGFRFAITSELLRNYTIAMVFMVITYYIISYSVKSVYTTSFTLEEDLTAFFGTLAIFTSGFALVVQLLFTNRLIQRFGVPAMNLFFPLFSLASFAGMIFHLGMPTAIAGTFNIKAVMPAIHNPVRSMFLNVLPQQIQGRARAMLIAIVLPISLFVTGILLLFLQELENPIYFLVPGTVAAALFLFYSIRMNHAYGKTLLTHLKEHLFLPEEQTATSMRLTGKDNLASIVNAVSNGEESSVSLARILAEAYPESAVEHIIPAIKNAEPKIADQLLKIASTTNDPAINQFLIENSGLHDNHFRSTSLKQLINSRDEKAIPLIRQAIDDKDPRVSIAGIHGALSWPLEKLHDQAIDHLNRLLNGSDTEQLAAIELIVDTGYIIDSETRNKTIQTCLDATARIFNSQTDAGKIQILNTYRHWDGKCGPDIQRLISEAMEQTDPRLRSAAVQCAHLLDKNDYAEKIEIALADGHALVREAAVSSLKIHTPDLEQLAIKWILDDNRGSPRAQKTLLNAIIDDMPHTTLESIVKNKIEDARHIYAALKSIRSHTDKDNRSIKLLKHVLKERFQQVLDITLTALEPMCAQNVISIIQAGIRTHDDRYMANACEALNSIPNRKLIQPLGQLLQDAFMPGQDKNEAKTENINSVLEKLMIRQDNWLRECANKTLVNIKENYSHG